MKKNRLLQGFVITLILALLLRLFVIDVISVSNDLLHPDFYPGDFLLISKLSTPEEGQWVLLKNYPYKSYYAVRKLVKKESDQGWSIVEPSPVTAIVQEKKNFVNRSQVAGQVVMILWSLPCKPAAATTGICSEKAFRFLKVIH